MLISDIQKIFISFLHLDSDFINGNTVCVTYKLTTDIIRFYVFYK